MTGFRHVVLLACEGADDAKIDALVDALRTLPAEIPELRSYVVGRDAGISPGNLTVAVVADFDDEAGYLAYRDNPTHIRVIEEIVKPIVTTRTAVQHRT